jgi:mitogen-activated protein kinase kinase
MSTAPQPRRPGGGRPNPTSSSSSGSSSRQTPPTQLQIPRDNVRESFHPPAPKLWKSPPYVSVLRVGMSDHVVAGINVDSAGQGGWQYPQSLPALALKPLRTPGGSSIGGSSRPKLSLSPLPTPQGSSDGPTQTASGNSSSLMPTASASYSVPSTKPPPLLHAASSSTNTPRRSTPALKLAISSTSTPVPSSSSYATSQYPTDHYLSAEDDYNQLNSELQTPLARHNPHQHAITMEDQNPTLQARGHEYDGEGESSFGYGRLDNGLRETSTQMSSMTEDIKAALSKSRYDSSPAPSIRNRSRASSITGSLGQGGSRRGSLAGLGDDLGMSGLNLDNNGNGSENGGCHGYQGEFGDDRGSERRGSLGSNEEGGWGEIDPDSLRTIKRLGEGTGGAVELVQDMRTGMVMAKKVGQLFVMLKLD